VSRDGEGQGPERAQVTETTGRREALVLAAVLAGLYALLVGVPLVRGVPPAVGAVAVTLLFALGALAAAAAGARVELPIWVELTGMLLGIFDWFMLASLGARTEYGRLIAVPAADVILVLALILGGRLLSRIVRERSLVIPIALVLALADIFTVFLGPTALALEEAPDLVAAISVKLPAMGSATGPAGVAGLRHVATLGPGDTFFATLLFAVILRFGLNLRRSFWWMYGIVGVVLAAAVAVPGMPPLPVLPLMAVGFLVVNWRDVRLTRTEWVYVAIVFAVVIALFAGLRVPVQALLGSS